MWEHDFKQYFYDNDKNGENNILTKHHIESFDDFIKFKIPEIVNNPNYNPLVIETTNHINEPIKIEMHFIINKDNFKLDNDKLYPNDCRINNLTYQAKYLIDFNIKYIKNNSIIKDILLTDITLATIPICLLSSYCNLYNIPRNEFKNLNECIYELGGYYIINGKEKTIISQDRLVSNKLYIHKGIYPDKYVTEIKSSRLTGFEMEKNTYLKYCEFKINKIKFDNINISDDNNSDNESIQSRYVKPSILDNLDNKLETIIPDHIQEEDVDIKTTADFTDITNNIKELDTTKFKFMISFPGIKEIPVFILFRALGIESDKDILSIILFNEPEYIQHIYLHILEPTLLDSHPIMTQQSALKYLLYNSFSNTMDELINEINNNFLPLYNNNYSKSVYLGYMINRSLQVIAGYKTTSDRDSLLYKRISTSGQLYAKLFREWFISFTLNARKIMKNLSTNINLDKNIIFTKLDFFKLIDKGGNQNIITDGITKGFRGNWGTKVFNKKVTVENIHERVNKDKYKHSTDGLVQELDRLNYFRSVYHLRQITTPIDKTLKTYGPRRLHLTQIGYICPTDTPDGGSCGITKNLAIGCSITSTTQINYDLFMNFLHINEFFIPLNNIIFSNHYLSYYIFYNGEIIGIYNNNKNVYNFFNLLKLLKRNNIILTHLTSIYINSLDKEIHIATDVGRCVRPVYVIYKNNKIRNLYDENADLNTLIKSEKNTKFNINTIYSEHFFKQLEDEQSSIELIDADEQYYSLIAIDDATYNIDTSKYNYLELHATLFLSATTNLLSFVNHSPTQRSQLACGQLKQCISFPCSNYQSRMDNFANVLHYPQKPICNTTLTKYLNYNHMPTGVNCRIAVLVGTGFNMEDAFIFNKDSIRRGLFCNTYYRTYIETISKDANEQFIKPDLQYRNKNLNYSKLDDNGIIKVNSYIDEHDVIIGKLTRMANDTVEYKDTSATIHHNDQGIVDYIIRGRDQFNQEFVKVRMLMCRYPEVGDKVGARIYQKGTIGSIVDIEDMPYDKDGNYPDLIINAAAVPTRMVNGILIEIITGLAMSNLGMFFDSIPFNNTDLTIISDILEMPQIQLNKYSNTILYNGITGEQIVADVFTGICYYQRFKQTVCDKIQSRAIGPYSSLNRQPCQGRQRGGGLRIGEMEISSLLSHGLCNFLHESITKRSDDFIVYISKENGTIVPYNSDEHYNPNNEDVIPIHLPFSTKLFFQELQQMNITVKMFT